MKKNILTTFIAYKKSGFKFSIISLFAVVSIFTTSNVAFAVAGPNTITKTDVTPGNQPSTFTGVPVYRLHVANASVDTNDTILSLAPTPSGSVVDTLVTLHFYNDINNDGLVDGGDTDLGASALFSSDDTIQTFNITDVTVPFGSSVNILITADGVGLANAGTFLLSFAAGADILMGTVQITGGAPGANLNALNVVDPVDITAASSTISVPVLGVTPQTAGQVETATSEADYTVTSVTWNEALTAGGKFKAGQAYTATVVLTSKNSKEFQAAPFTPIVLGSASVGLTTTTGIGVGNTISFLVTYASTGALAVTGISVSVQPTKMSYVETTDDVLALNGMVVTETNNDGSTSTATFVAGTNGGYSASPANGATLTVAENGTTTTITHTASGQITTTGAATVLTELAAYKITGQATLAAASSTYNASVGLYSGANWLTLTAFNTSGVAAITAASNLAGVDTATSTAISGMDGVLTIAEELADYKVIALGVLATASSSYNALVANYSPANWTTLTDFNSNGIIAINAAGTTGVVDTASTTAINGMDGVLTLVEELAAAKVTAHGVLTTALASYTEGNYTGPNWIILNGFKTTGDADIDASTIEADVSTAQGMATTGMDGVLTIAEELADYKVIALGVLATASSSYNALVANYSPANWTTLTDFNSNGIIAINAAGTTGVVDTASTTAINGMDGVLTLVEAEVVLVAEYTDAISTTTVKALLDANVLGLTLTNYSTLGATGKTSVATALFDVKGTLTSVGAIQAVVTPAIATAVADKNLATAKATEASLTSTDYISYSAVTAALSLPETNDGQKITKTASINGAISGLVTVASIFSSVSATLVSAGILNNLDTVTGSNYTNFSGLYFEKRGDVAATSTALGRITFTSSLDLSNGETQLFLQNLGTKLDMSGAGIIGLDFSAATSSNTLKGVTATIKFFGLNAIGFSEGSTAAEINAKLIALDDNGVALDKSLLISTSTPATWLGACEVGGYCTVYEVPVNHFTKYKVDITAPTVAEIDNLTFDVTISANATAILTFSKELSSSGKASVQNALTAGADKVITYGWNATSSILTITGHATDVTTFANDVVANVTDVAGNSNALLLIDSVLDSTQIAPSEGSATLSTTTPEVVITNPLATTTVTINSDVTSPTLDVSSFISNGTGTLPAINITSENASNTEVAIPADTVVTSASTTWNGIISAPTVTTVTLPTESGVTKTLSTAIEVGFSGGELTFSKAVRLLLPNQSNKRAGYVRTGISFTEITNTCASDDQATGDALASGSECKINASNGTDLVIWTKHFTTFASYTQTTNVAATSFSSGGSWFVSAPASVASAQTVTNTPTPTAVAQVNSVTQMEGCAGGNKYSVLTGQLCITATSTVQGKVLGITVFNFLKDLRMGMRNSDVKELQKLLITEGYLKSEVTGYFGIMTKRALAKWQAENKLPNTGYFGSMTRSLLKKMNAQ